MSRKVCVSEKCSLCSRAVALWIGRQGWELEGEVRSRLFPSVALVSCHHVQRTNIAVFLGFLATGK